MSKTWFITGSSRGLGRRFAEAALSRGDRVAATARDTATLDELVATYGDHVLPLSLDVTDRAAVVKTVALAHQHFGRLDVIVNNAGIALVGMVEELTEEDVRAQFDTSVFGTLWVAQAALPYLRAQGSGHIINLSSVLGLAAFASTGAYTAAKAAVEGLSDSLAQEAVAFGIKVTVVEPGPYNTEFAANSTYAKPLDAYDDLREQVNAGLLTLPHADLAGVGPALLKVVDADNPPTRVFFGTLPLQIVPPIYTHRLKNWQDWAWLSTEAMGQA